MEDADLGVVSRAADTRKVAQERSMTMRRIALQTSLALDHKRRCEQALHHAAKHYKGELHVGQPLWFWRRGRNAAKRPTSAFWHAGVVISNTLATVWIAYRGSLVKCARSQVRPFTGDDEAAHEHITEHVRDWENDDYTKETSRMKTSQDTKSPQWAHQHQEKTQRQDIKNPMEKVKWMWTQNLEDVCEEKPD